MGNGKQGLRDDKLFNDNISSVLTTCCGGSCFIRGEGKMRGKTIRQFLIDGTADGQLKFIITEAETTDGEIMTIGNTQTPVKFRHDSDTYMDEWFGCAPTHHFAISVGHNVALFEKTACLLGIPSVVLDK